MKRPDEVNSWEYLNEHLRQKQLLYEPGFVRVKPHARSLQKFRSLNALTVFFRHGTLRQQEKIRAALIELGRTDFDLRPRVLEVLMMVLWEELTTRYGRGDRFAESYLDLMREMLAINKPSDR